MNSDKVRQLIDDIESERVIGRSHAQARIEEMQRALLDVVGDLRDKYDFGGPDAWSKIDHAMKELHRLRTRDHERHRLAQQLRNLLDT